MPARFRLRRACAVLGVLLAIGFAVPRILTHVPYQRLGLTLSWTPQGNARVQEIIGPPSKGLLEPGDMLVRINGEPMRRPLSGVTPPQRTLPKEAITFEVLRRGETFEVTVPPVRLTLWQRVRFLLFRLAALVAAPIVAFVLLWRRPDLGTASVFLWFAALQGVGVVHQIYRYSEAELQGAFRLWMGLQGWVVCWVPAAFLHFLAVFPRPRWESRSRLRSVWFWLVAVAYAVPVYFVYRLLATGSFPYAYMMYFESTALVLGVVSLIDRYGGPARENWQPARSQRALGLAVAVLMLIAGGVSLAFVDTERADLWLQFPTLRLLVTVVSIGMLLTPFALAYLLARDPAFDPRRILERSLPFALLSGVLAAVYLTVVLFGQRLFAVATGEETLAFNVVAALVLAFAFAPLREKLQQGLARFFRRDPLALRAALDQAGQELLGALDRDEVRASVEAGLTRGLGRAVPLEWPALGGPVLGADEDLPDHARAGVENLLRQATIRLENLALQAERAEAERRAIELREAATRAELRALHAQVQPHFLFNALNALSYLTEVDPPAAQRFTERLADMLRYTVQASDRPAVPLSEEIHFVEDYLGVARERYDGELSFQYRGAEALLTAAVPPLVLQPLVENSLKYGFSSERPALRLVLDAGTEGDWLTLTFSDDGCRDNGNGTNGRAVGLGVGLENLEQRIRRFGGAGATMEAGPGAGGGFRVAMRWKQRAGGDHDGT